MLGTSRQWLYAAIAAISVAAPAQVRAEVLYFGAILEPEHEVPPVNSAGGGHAHFTFDTVTKVLTWNITYSMLSGPATAAHIHGPADEGQNAPVVIPFPTAGSPITGSITLTDAQAAQLRAEKWYVNIHTAAHPNGEIRGGIEN